VSNPLCEAGHHLILPHEHAHELDDESRWRYCAAVIERGLAVAHEEFVAYLESHPMKGH
jgi:hypothetical protein